MYRSTLRHADAVLVILFLSILTACTSKSSNAQKDSTVAAPNVILSEEDIKTRALETAKNGNTAPDGDLLRQDSVLVSTKDFRAKLLIIDFWATWCAPCIDEAPSFKALEKKYESDKVEFITVSVDGEFEYWREFLNEHSWEGDSYWYGMKEAEDFFSYMYSQVEIDGTQAILISLPKYVVISPSGKILDNRAPRPSTPAFEKQLISWIKDYAS